MGKFWERFLCIFLVADMRLHSGFLIRVGVQGLDLLVFRVSVLC